MTKKEIDSLETGSVIKYSYSYSDTIDIGFVINIRFAQHHSGYREEWVFKIFWGDANYTTSEVERTLSDINMELILK